MVRSDIVDVAIDLAKKEFPDETPTHIYMRQLLIHFARQMSYELTLEQLHK